jgi:tRNA-modifying protein YgfZ
MDMNIVAGEAREAPATLVHPEGDAAAQDRALHEGAALFDRGDRGRLSLSGAKAAELLTGLVTSDVLALAPGHGQYSAMLTPKGKLLADLRIFAFAGADGTTTDRLLVDTGARAADNLLGTIRKYVNPRLAPYRDERATLAVVGVHGPRAHEVVATATGLDAGALAELSPWSHRSADVEGAAVVVAHVPELLVGGFDLFVPVGAAPALVARLARAGAHASGAAAWEVARVEAGRPEWGVDMDDATIPQEANFDELGGISYTKGCYTGQETVARVHFRGHVNRHLGHLHFTGGLLAPRGTALVDEAGKPVGDVRSGVVSPRAGAIAIAMVRREVPVGAQLLARWEGGEAVATVAPLPYMASSAA